MKIQTLAVIFILIILPISLVLTSYIRAEVETVKLDVSYNSKLLNSTYDAIKAFQLNTVNNTESDITESRISDIQASVNSFYNSLLTNFGYSGYSLDVMSEYVPAIVYTMYDGYYIYSPYTNILTDVKVKSDSTYGENDKIYGLKPYVYYTCRYIKDNSDFVITYSLDNYITVQGKVKGTYVNKSGYLIDNIKITRSLGSSISYSNYELLEGMTTREKYGNAINVVYEGLEIGDEVALTEYVGDKEYEYIKLNGTKYYYDLGTNDIKDDTPSTGDDYIFYILNGKKQVQASYGSAEFNEYKSRIEKNNSAKRYYVDALEFTGWVYKNLGDITTDHAQVDGSVKNRWGAYQIFKSGNIQDSDSDFNRHRLAVIRNCIETNLQTAISNYASGYIMPKISETDWDMLINNVCLITFMQGISIGGKVYNGYAIVKNTLNKEVVANDSIYITTVDEKYHRITSNLLRKDSSGHYSESELYQGVLNLDFERHMITNEKDNSIMYFYPKSPTGAEVSNKIYYADYTSIISQTGTNTSQEDIYKYMRDTNISDKLKKMYYTALGRERYGSYKVNNNELLNY